MIEAIRYNNLNQGSGAILSKLGEEGGSVVTRDCGVGSCLGRSAPESVCVGFGAGDVIFLLEDGWVCLGLFRVSQFPVLGFEFRFYCCSRSLAARTRTLSIIFSYARARGHPSPHDVALRM